MIRFELLISVDYEPICTIVHVSTQPYKKIRALSLKGHTNLCLYENILSCYLLFTKIFFL